MRFFALGLLFATPLLATFLEDHEVEQLLKRQEPGTPQYDCHADCGGIITLSRTDGFCSLDEFKTKFDACMNCALVYNIWQYYGSSVSRAATTCGLVANPVSPSSTSAPSSTVVSSTEVPPVSTSSSAVASSAVTSSAASSADQTTFSTTVFSSSSPATSSASSGVPVSSSSLLIASSHGSASSSVSGTVSRPTNATATFTPTPSASVILSNGASSDIVANGDLVKAALFMAGVIGFFP